MRPALLIQPGEWPLDGESLVYESCHALRSAIGSNFYNRKSRALLGVATVQVLLIGIGYGGRRRESGGALVFKYLFDFP